MLQNLHLGILLPYSLHQCSTLASILLYISDRACCHYWWLGTIVPLFHYIQHRYPPSGIFTFIAFLRLCWSAVVFCHNPLVFLHLPAFRSRYSLPLQRFCVNGTVRDACGIRRTSCMAVISTLARYVLWFLCLFGTATPSGARPSLHVCVATGVWVASSTIMWCTIGMPFWKQIVNTNGTSTCYFSL